MIAVVLVALVGVQDRLYVLLVRDVGFILRLVVAVVFGQTRAGS
jgi:hypothetical protein